jgi:hypothetical protein
MVCTGSFVLFSVFGCFVRLVVIAFFWTGFSVYLHHYKVYYTSCKWFKISNRWSTERVCEPVSFS